LYCNLYCNHCETKVRGELLTIRLSTNHSYINIYKEEEEEEEE